MFCIKEAIGDGRARLKIIQTVGVFVVFILLAVFKNSSAQQTALSTPRVMNELQTTGMANLCPFLSGDGLSLYWVKGIVTFCATRSSVTAPFGGGAAIAGLPTNITGIWLSNDQRTIFYTKDNLLYYSIRANVSDGFYGSQQIVINDDFTGYTISSPSLTQDLGELYLCLNITGTSSPVNVVVKLQRQGTTFTYFNPLMVTQFMTYGSYGATNGQLSKNGLSFYIAQTGRPDRVLTLLRFTRQTLSSTWDNGTLVLLNGLASPPSFASPSLTEDEKTVVFSCWSLYAYCLYTSNIKNVTPPTLVPIEDPTTRLRPVFKWRKLPGSANYTIAIKDAGFTFPTTATITDTSYTLSRDITMGTVIWSVRGDSSFGIAFDTFFVYNAQNPTIIPQPKFMQERRPTFRWHSTPGATSYAITIRYGAGYLYATPDSISDTVYTPSTDMPPDKYWWTVQNRSASWGTQKADTFYITTTNIPQLIRFDGAADTTHKPTLRWNSVCQYEKYTIKVSVHPDFSTELFRITAYDTRYVSPILPHGKFYWTAAFAPADTFAFIDSLIIVAAVAPELVYPYRYWSVALTDSLMWKRVTNATSYRFDLAKTSSFTNSLFGSSSTPDTVFKFQGLEYSARYYWRVAANVGPEIGAWAIDSFVTENAPPPRVLYPDSSSRNVSKHPVMVWNKVANGATYRVHLGTDYSYSRFTFAKDSITDTTLQLPDLKGGTTYYYLIGTTFKGVFGGFSRGRFSTPIGAPIQYAPLSGGIGAWLPLTFRWEKYDSYTYNLEVDTSILFENPIFANNYVVDSILTIGRDNGLTLEHDRKYYWRVQVDGIDTTPWGMDSFYTSSYPTIENVYPLNGAMVPADSIVFTWKKNNPHIKGFWFAIAIDTAMTSFVIDTLVNDTCISINGRLLAGRRYWWGVRAANNINPYSRFETNFLLKTQSATAVLPKVFECRMQTGASRNGSMLSYALAKESNVQIKIFTIQGRTIKAIMSKQQPAGYYTVPLGIENVACNYLFIEFNAGDFRKIMPILVE